MAQKPIAWWEIVTKQKNYLRKKKMINLAHHPWVLDVLQLNTGNVLLLELAAAFKVREMKRDW